MVLHDDDIWKRSFTARMSQFFESYYEARGVRFAKNTTVAEFTGSNVIETAVLQNGTSLNCDTVVAGIGVRPVAVTEPAASGGIEVADGVVVNEFLETSHPDIYAAGDVAHYNNVLGGKRRRVEHWDNAVAQGQHCARCSAIALRSFTFLISSRMFSIFLTSSGEIRPALMRS